MGQDRIIITDAWTPQVNGVVRTYENVQTQLVRMGVSFSIIHPYWKEFSRMPCPEYPEIELVTNPWKLVPILKRLQGSRFHIATEGPLGLVARLYLASKGISYTTSYHTKYPEFLKELIGIPATWTYPFFRWFHRDSSHVLVPTARLREELEVKGFQRVCVWSSGIDRDLFNPIHRDLQAYVGPYVVCVSRVSKEKGLDDFCQLPKELTKVLVGDGPYLSELKEKYPDVFFMGRHEHEALASLIANAQVFVFPSKTDTFGLVILEALACGTPVAAYPEPGPLEVIRQGINGIYNEDLFQAVMGCWHLDREKVRASTEKYSWERSTSEWLLFG